MLRGNPTEVLPKCMKEWAVTKLCFEHDTEPYALKRDAAMKEAAEQAGVEVWSQIPNHPSACRAAWKAQATSLCNPCKVPCRLNTAGRKPCGTYII